MICVGGFIVSLTFFTLARLAFAARAPPPFTYSHGYGQHDGRPGRLGAVASESSICSRVGTDLLRKGGNAADAVGCPSK
jgi:gamma-glutamyltranspeptidase/glutathione hydrolase